MSVSFHNNLEEDPSLYSPLHTPALESGSIGGAIIDLDAYRGLEKRSQLPLYIGMVASNGYELNPTLYLKARQFRADTYIDQKKFLPPDAREADGGESDPDDKRSTHYVVSQRSSEMPVVGNSRVITKRTEEDDLPVEEMFDIPHAPVGSVESSRYIASHPNKDQQRKISLALIRAMTFHALREDAPALYAVVERPLFRYFNGIGIPFVDLAEPQYIPEYRTKNLPIVVDPKLIIPGIRAKDEGRDMKLAPFFDRAASRDGLGNFTEELE